MLVSGGKILALSKVYKDETLAGSGTPSSPLGVSESYTTSTQNWVKDYVSAVAGDTIPYSGVEPIRISNHKVSFNSAGFASESWVKAQKYAPSAWADTRYAKKTDLPDLDPYALKTDVYTKQQADDTFIPRTASGNWDVKEYSAGNGIGISQHKISVTADYILQSWLEENYYNKTEIETKLAELGGYKVVEGDPDTHEPIYDGDDKSKWIFLTEDPAAYGNDKYFEWIWLSNAWKCIGETSMDLDGYATDKELQTAIDNLSATYLKKEDFHDTTYAAGANIHIYGNDNTISGRDWTPELTTIQEDVDKKLYTSAFNNWSAHAFDGYATETWVTGQLEQYATTDWVNANFSGKEALAEEFAKYYTKNEADETFVSADTFNSYTAEINEDLGNISASLDDKIDKTASANWDLANYSGKDGIKIENHWVSISSDFVTPDELTDELKGYYTKDETSGAEALAEEFAKYQPSGNYITSAAADEKYIPKTWSANKDFTPYSGGDGIKVENHIISLSAVPQTVEITSEDDSVDITTSADPQTGITTYDLSVKQVDETVISGENGVSAKYDEEEKTWLVGLTDYREKASWGQVTSDYTTYVSGSEKIIDLNAPTIVGDDIAISTGGDITLGEGLYHIDAQIDINVPAENIAASYYDVLFTIGNRSTIHELDASYAHAETVNLSFDIKVGASASPIAMYIAQLPVGAQYKVRNFNIHEVVTIDALIEGSEQQTYEAGIGIQKYNDPISNHPTFSAKIGLGLSADANGFFNVACGSGLKIDAQGGVMAVTLDEVTEEVVNTVTELKGDLDTKVTVNFDYSNIDDSYNFDTVGSTTGQGVLLGYLFAVPINAKVYTDDDATSEYETLVGVYSKQQYTQNYVMFGLYEYDPSYPQWNPSHTEISGYGRTVPLCDTGAVKLKAGFNEFPIKHVNDKGETSPELKSSCLYYATLYVSKNPGGGIMLAGCPGYKTTFNTIPQITLDQANVNYDLGAMSPEERAAWSYNDMGWGSWGGTENYHELPSAPRFFMQVRNKKKDTTV